MDTDVIVSSRRHAIIVVVFANQTIWPLKVDVLDRLAAFLVHYIREWRRRCCYIGYRKILLHDRRCQEECKVEDLGERVGDVARGHRKFAVSRDVERYV